MFGRDNIDAMRERGAGQIGIDQRYHPADLDDAQPDGHIFGPIPHHQADHVAFGEALVERPSGILVRAIYERAIGEALAFGQQGRRIAKQCGAFLDNSR